MTKIKLSDVLARSTANFDAPVSISDSGKYIYIVYNITVAQTGSLISELFENVNGKLVSIRSIYGNVQYNNIDSGFASPDFKYFTLLDDDQINTARIRLFDKNMNLITTRLFDDFYSVGYSFNGGTFSQDGKYIALTYIYQNTSPQQSSILRILDAKTLVPIAEYRYSGNTYSPLKFLQQNNKTFILFESTFGIFDYSQPAPNAPSLLNVLKLKKHTLKLKDSVSLPQLANFDVISNDNNNLIVVGTDRADLPNEITIHQILQPSFLPHDGDELRFYKLKKSKLKLKNKKNIKEGIYTIFYPDGEKILLNKIGENYLNTFGIVDINDLKLDSSTVFNFSLPYFTAAFSRNGKWLITTGAYPDSNGINVYEQYNIQLYKIK